MIQNRNILTAPPAPIFWHCIGAYYSRTERHGGYVAIHSLTPLQLAALSIARKGSLAILNLNVGTVWCDLALSLQLRVLVLGVRGEAPLLRDQDFFPAGELVLGAAER